MNTLIIYDSHYGNTERIARTIADSLRDSGQAQAARVDVARALSLHGVDLLILGSPTQGFRPTPAMQAMLKDIAAQVQTGQAVACFDTRFRGFFWKDSAASSMVRQLHALGIKPIVAPESFFVKAMRKEGPLLAGEVERAATWARTLLNKVEVPRHALR